MFDEFAPVGDPQDNPVKMKIPDAVKASIDEWVICGRSPGHFVQAVLRSDLFGAFRHGDAESLAALYEIVNYVYNRIPAPCWGSQEKMENWSNQGGQKGIHDARVRQEQLTLGGDDN
jgi:hypothetical protein